MQNFSHCTFNISLSLFNLSRQFSQRHSIQSCFTILNHRSVIDITSFEIFLRDIQLSQNLFFNLEPSYLLNPILCSTAQCKFFIECIFCCRSNTVFSRSTCNFHLQVTYSYFLLRVIIIQEYTNQRHTPYSSLILFCSSPFSSFTIFRQLRSQNRAFQCGMCTLRSFVTTINITYQFIRIAEAGFFYCTRRCIFIPLSMSITCTIMSLNIFCQINCFIPSYFYFRSILDSIGSFNSQMIFTGNFCIIQN